MVPCPHCRSPVKLGCYEGALIDGTESSQAVEVNKLINELEFGSLFALHSLVPSTYYDYYDYFNGPD